MLRYERRVIRLSSSDTAVASLPGPAGAKRLRRTKNTTASATSASAKTPATIAATGMPFGLSAPAGAAAAASGTIDTIGAGRACPSDGPGPVTALPCAAMPAPGVGLPSAPGAASGAGLGVAVGSGVSMELGVGWELRPEWA